MPPGQYVGVVDGKIYPCWHDRSGDEDRSGSILEEARLHCNQDCGHIHIDHTYNHQTNKIVFHRARDFI